MQINYSQERGELFKALSKAQGELSGAKKDSKNPFFKSNYADLASNLEAAREALEKQGLCVIQTLGNKKGAQYLETTLGHSSGQWMSGQIPILPDKAGPQGLGSCITYARRYSFAAIVGLAQVDDDAEAATNRKPSTSISKDPIWTKAKAASDGGLEELKDWHGKTSRAEKEVLAAGGARWDKLKANAIAVDAKAAA